MSANPRDAACARARVDGGRHRAVLDLQACQTEDSRGRGIGRYSRSFALAVASAAERFHCVVCLNDAFADSAGELAREFEPLVGARNVVRYDASRPVPTPGAAPIDSGRIGSEWIARHAWLAQKPDLIHVSSIFEGLRGRAVVPDLAGLPSTSVVSATAYDLIPLIFADRYLGDPVTRDWYDTRIDRLRRCDVLLAISEATRSDVIERIGIPAERVVAIHAAADARFVPGEVSEPRRRELLGRLGLTKPFVMYTGGIDHRKNVEATIRAFALLPPSVRERYQLAIVCSVAASDRDRLQRLVKSSRLPPASVVLTGFVSDDDLVDLYRCCELFVFPSRYEGFGLPVLEAMACGAPTIAADASSLPEIVGRKDALFSIDSDGSIAAGLARALGDPDYRRSLRAHARDRAKLYSWERVARRAGDAWAEALARKRAGVAVDVSARRPRLALVTPLLPERSGIADFVTESLPHLAEYFRIDLFASEGADSARYRAMGFDVYAWQTLPCVWLEYDAGVFYQFGNSQFHVHMLALLQACPGAVFLHDAFLSGLMAYLEFGAPRMSGFFGEMLRYAHGDAALGDYLRNGLDATIERRPMTRWVADRSTGMFVTSSHARDILEREGQVDGARCMVVRHMRGVQVVSDDDRARERALLGISESDLLVCTFGLADDRKLWLELVEAWSRCAMRTTARLVFVGEAAGAYGEALRRAIAGSPKVREMRVTGYVSDEEFLRYVRSTDIAVQLRKGSRGEASGASLYAMAHGVPLVASRHGSLAEIPDFACIHVDDPLDVAQLASVVAELGASADKRSTIGRRGRAWLAEACDPAAIARAMARDLACFNDKAIAHREADLNARATAVSALLPEAQAPAWLRDLRDRTQDLEAGMRPPALARLVARTLGRLGAVAGASYPGSDAPFEIDATDDTLTLLAVDARFQTECGVRTETAVDTTARAGFLLYGPYLGVGPGRYRVRVFGSQSPRGVVQLEITCDAGCRRLAACALAGAGARDAADGMLGRLDFAVDRRVSDLEIRVQVSADVRMSVESLDIVPITA